MGADMNSIAKDSIVAVIGAGTMGAGIAQVTAQAGYQTLLLDQREGAAADAIAGIAKRFELSVSKGKLSAEEADAILLRLSPAQETADLAPAALVVEAIIENLEIKQTLLRELESILASDAIIGSNTSSISITALAAGLAHPERVVGLHFFNPAPLMPLVEVVYGINSDAAIVDRTVAWVNAWNKYPIRVKSAPGFVVNRVARPFYAEGLRLLDEGLTDAVTLDAIMRESGGYRMGPCELSDLIGQDINLAVTQSMHAAFYGEPRYKPTRIQEELVAAGMLGRKSGRGFYDYREGAENASPSCADGAEAPKKIRFRLHDGGSWQSLMGRMTEAGLEAESEPCLVHELGCIEVDGVVIAPSDGRTASEVAVELLRDDVVVMDLCLDFASAKRIALAAAPTTSADARQSAAGFFQALGMQVSWLQDLPGLVVTRIAAQLVNEALETERAGVAGREEIDEAMRLGANYPRGPFAWLETLGPRFIYRVLANLRDYYGEERYRSSPLLRRELVESGQPLV
jgi:3-hydroxybutyryl-CoA dehydrogenase